MVANMVIKHPSTNTLEKMFSLVCILFFPHDAMLREDIHSIG